MSLNIIVYLSSFATYFLTLLFRFLYIYFLLNKFWQSTCVNVRLSYRSTASLSWILSSLYCYWIYSTTFSNYLSIYQSMYVSIYIGCATVVRVWPDVPCSNPPEFRLETLNPVQSSSLVGLFYLVGKLTLPRKGGIHLLCLSVLDLENPEHHPLVMGCEHPRLLW